MNCPQITEAKCLFLVFVQKLRPALCKLSLGKEGQPLFAALVVGVLLFFSVFGNVAYAYVLPAEFLLKMSADARRIRKFTTVSAVLNVEYDGKSSQERLFLKVPGKLRWLHADGTLRVESAGVVSEDRAGIISQLSDPLSGFIDDLTATLFVPGGGTLSYISAQGLEVLQRSGVDTSVTALGRYEGDHVAYIIGARAWEPERSQVWISKEHWQPVRVILHDKKSGHGYETRYLEYGSPIGGNWFPRVIEHYIDGVRIKRAVVQQLKTNRRLKDSLFVFSASSVISPL